MKTIESNKLIAEFMGCKPIGGISYGLILLEPIKKEVTIDSLEYNTSWDWLMPVVEKIEQVCSGVPNQLLHLSLFSELSEVYNGVVEFILSYNENNKS